MKISISRIPRKRHLNPRLTTTVWQTICLRSLVVLVASNIATSPSDSSQSNVSFSAWFATATLVYQHSSPQTIQTSILFFFISDDIHFDASFNFRLRLGQDIMFTIRNACQFILFRSEAPLYTCLSISYSFTNFLTKAFWFPYIIQNGGYGTFLVY